VCARQLLRAARCRLLVLASLAKRARVLKARVFVGMYLVIRGQALETLARTAGAFRFRPVARTAGASPVLLVRFAFAAAAAFAFASRVFGKGLGVAGYGVGGEEAVTVTEVVDV
jgi:hypothetical protein